MYQWRICLQKVKGIFWIICLCLQKHQTLPPFLESFILFLDVFYAGLFLQVHQRNGFSDCSNAQSNPTRQKKSIDLFLRADTVAESCFCLVQFAEIGADFGQCERDSDEVWIVLGSTVQMHQSRQYVSQIPPRWFVVAHFYKIRVRITASRKSATGMVNRSENRFSEKH